jgi:hypothetical protein
VKNGEAIPPLPHTTQPPIHWVSAAISLGAKQQGHKVEHSHLVLRLITVELYIFMAKVNGTTVPVLKYLSTMP